MKNSIHKIALVTILLLGITSAMAQRNVIWVH